MKHIIFVPGSFSPFHDGHYFLIKQLINDNNKINIIISNKNRENIDTNVINNFIKKIFKNNNNIEIIISKTSPIKYIYEHTIANCDVSYSMIRSNKNNDINVVNEYINAFSATGKFHNNNINVSEYKINYTPLLYNNKDFLSATILRNEIVNNNFDNFLQGYKNLIKDKLIDENDVLALFNELKQNTNNKN